MRVKTDNQVYEEKCWFCENGVADIAAAATVEMHTGGFLGKGLEYYVLDTATLSVPRCERCKEVHDRVEGHVAKGGIIGLIIGVLVALFTLNALGFDSILDIWKFLLGEIIVIGMVGGVLAWMLGRRSLPKGVKDQRAREHHPKIREKISEGWKIGHRPPGL